MTEILVVGGGPVGLAAAIEARLRGLECTVVEPRDGAIDKACGEGLMPGAVPLLERLGVHPEGHPLTGVSYRAGGRTVDHLFTHGTGLGVRRLALHTALHDRAVALGVRFRHGRVVGVTQDAVSVTLNLADGGTATADWVLACDGLHSTLRRLLQLDRPGWPVPASRRYGLRRHVAVAPWSSLIEVHWTPRAEVYVTPVADDTVGIAMLGPRGGDLDLAIASVPALADRVAGAEAASSLRGAGPFHQRSAQRVAGRVLLVGDASGYVDAITGEGLRLGFAQAEVAVRAIAQDRPENYEDDWRRVTRDFRMLTSGLVAAARSPLRAAIVPVAVALPRVFGVVVERLAR